jgi:hypothetical protein
LAEARRIDEVKDIRDKAVAMQEYAKQAKDGQLVGWSTEIRARAEDRGGQMLAEMGEDGARAKGGGDLRKEFKPATLSDLGVTKAQSHRWQRFAALPAEVKEEKIQLAVKKAIAVVEGTSNYPAGERSRCHNQNCMTKAYNFT